MTVLYYIIIKLNYFLLCSKIKHIIKKALKRIKIFVMIGKSLRTEIDINDDLTVQHSGSGKMFNKSSQHCDNSRTCSS